MFFTSFKKVNLILMEIITKQLHQVCPGFQIIGTRGFTPIELLYRKIDDSFFNTHIYLTTKKYNYPFYMNIKLNMQLDLQEVYPSVIDASIEQAVPNCREIIYDLYNHDKDTHPYCSYSIIEKRITHYYWAASKINSDLQNIKVIFRKDFRNPFLVRFYIQFNYDKELLNKFGLDISDLEQPDYIILFYKEKQRYIEDQIMIEPIESFILGYNPSNENYEKVNLKL